MLARLFLSSCSPKHCLTWCSGGKWQLILHSLYFKFVSDVINVVLVCICFRESISLYLQFSVVCLSNDYYLVMYSFTVLIIYGSN